MRVSGVDTRQAADALRGELVELEPEWFPDERPLCAFVGATAVNDETGETIGEIVSVMHNGAHPILVIGDDESMVPFVEQFIGDITDDEVRILPIPGLL